MAWSLPALLPPLVTAWHVLRNAVDVPFWDQWALVPMMAGQTRGHIPWSELAASHNGHRILLPRIVFLGLARLSDWDVRWEQVASLIVAAGTLAVLASLVRRTLGGLGPAWRGGALLLVSALTFSLAQWENWAWGFQLQIVMAALFAALAAWIAGRARARDAVLLVTVAAAGAFSFGAGLALVPVVVLALLLQPAPMPRRRRWARVLAAAAAGALLVALYVRGAGGPTGTLAWTDLPRLALFVLAYLGGPWEDVDLEVAIAAGATGAGLWGLLALALWLREPAQRHKLLPWLLLGCFSAGSGALVAVGRGEHGLGQALAPRYVTLSTPLWIALVATATLALAGGGTRRAPARVVIALAVLGLMGARLVRANVRGVHCLEGRAADLRFGAALLRSSQLPPPGSLEFLFEEARVVQALPALRATRLSLYARPSPLPRLEDLAPVSADGPAGAIELVAIHPGHRHCVRIGGWVADPGHGELESIVLAVHGAVVAELPVAAGAGERLPWEHHLSGCSPHMVGRRLEAHARLRGGRILALDGARPLLGAPGE